jgi:hypothetical protein
VGKKGGGLGATLVLAFVIVLVGVGLGLVLSTSSIVERVPVVGPLLFEEEPAQTTTSPVVVEGIQDLNQLATVRWRESVIVTRESGGTELERLLVGEKVLLVAAGDVEAGVHLESLGRDDVRVSGETVTIRLPEPVILSVSLDEGATRVYDRDFGPLNVRPDDDLVEQARAAAVERLEQTARDEDILEQAERSAENGIRAFVTSLGFEEVRFE